jgi:hypothetical protein
MNERAEPRADLPKWLEDALDVGIYPEASPAGTRTAWQDGWNSGVIHVSEKIEDAARAESKVEPLDVERLARAIHEMDPDEHRPDAEPYCEYMAEAIWARYSDQPPLPAGTAR